jgi:hypothetical protein
MFLLVHMHRQQERIVFMLKHKSQAATIYVAECE